jgi:hypothetical protein
LPIATPSVDPRRVDAGVLVPEQGVPGDEDVGRAAHRIPAGCRTSVADRDSLRGALEEVDPAISEVTKGEPDHRHVMPLDMEIPFWRRITSSRV